VTDVDARAIEAQIRAWADELADQVPTHVASELVLGSEPASARGRLWWLVAAVALLVVAAGAVVATRDRDEVVPAEPAMLADEAWEPFELTIDGARISDDGRRLTFDFVGGPEYDPADPCSVGYRAVIQQSATEVRYRLEQRAPPNQPSTLDCTSEGLFRSASAQLDAPLGDRVVRSEDGRRVAVADEVALADVGALPDGWGRSGPATSFGGRWEHSFMLVSGAGPCDSTPVSLTQGPPAMLDERAPPGTHDVTAKNSVRDGANIEVWRDPSTIELRWTENSQAFIITAQQPCEDASAAPVERLFELARALRIPPG